MSLMITGDKSSLEALRQELLAEPQAAHLSISEPKFTDKPALETPEDVLVGQPWEAAEAVWVILITLPVSVAGELVASQIEKRAVRPVEDWVRAWLQRRKGAAQVQVYDLPAPAEQDTAPDQKKD